MSLAENVKRLREQKQFSQSELAKLVGVTQQTISGIEKGKKKKPKADTIINLAKSLDTTAEELVSE